MKHDEKKIKKLMRNYDFRWRMESDEVEMMKQYAEHIRKQTIEEIVEMIEKTLDVEIHFNSTEQVRGQLLSLSGAIKKTLQAIKDM